MDNNILFIIDDYRNEAKIKCYLIKCEIIVVKAYNLFGKSLLS